MGQQRKQLATVLAVACAILVVAQWFRAPLPPDVLDSRTEASAEYRDNAGQLLDVRASASGVRCMWRPLNDISPEILRAFVAVEDVRFWDHRGVDWRSVLRASWTGLNGKRSGASTISMQLAGMLYPESRGYLNSLRKALLAMRLERTMSKAQIVEQYLNRVPLGRGVHGVEAAAFAYFGHGAEAATASEALLLAALARAPSRLDPRHNAVAACQTYAAIDSRHTERAQDACIALIRPQPWPKLQAADLGLFPRTGGVWHTTLSAEVQSVVERSLAANRQRLLTWDVDSAAVVVVDNASGEVRATSGTLGVGGTPNYVNCAISPRQAGSILKPFLYAMAFEKGLAPADRLPDYPRCFRRGDSLYCPANASGRHLGSVSTEVALASSLNLPAVNLLERIGVEAFLGRLQQLDIARESDADEVGLALALGDMDVRLLDLAAAYSSLLRGGEFIRPQLVTGVRSTPQRVFERRSAEFVVSTLENEAAREVGFGAGGRQELCVPVALKTGTSSFGRDLWAIGGTQTWTVGVWAGRADGRPTDAMAMTVAVPLFRDIVESLECGAWRE